MRRRDVLAGGAATLGVLGSPSIVRAQAWPSREITIIVAVGPGSSADTMEIGRAHV